MSAIQVDNLEADAKAQFDVSRLALATVRAEASESTEAAVVVETKEVVGPLVMVEHVGEDALEFQADALGHPDVLLDAEVHIPEVQGVENSIAAVPVIDSQNRVTPVVGLEDSVGEIIHGVPVGLS